MVTTRFELFRLHYRAEETNHASLGENSCLNEYFQSPILTKVAQIAMDPTSHQQDPRIPLHGVHHEHHLKYKDGLYFAILISGEGAAALRSIGSLLILIMRWIGVRAPCRAPARHKSCDSFH
jgi:hypothetical protein